MSGDGDIADIASVMGFSGFGMYRLWCPLIYYKLCCLCRGLNEMTLFLPGKKARTFDLEAIFEQTRRTAIERSQHVLGWLSVLWSVEVLFCQEKCMTAKNVLPRGATESGRGRWKLHICPVLSSLSERKPSSPILQVIWYYIVKVNVMFQF